MQQPRDSEWSEMHPFCDSETYRELHLLFDFNPDLLETPENPRTPINHATLPPLSFYDKHLSDRTCLKRIRIMPTLLSDIASTVDVALKAVQDRGLHLPPVTKGSFYTEEKRKYRRGHTIYHINSIIDSYKSTTSTFCLPVASTLVIHPDGPRWDYALEWSRNTDRLPGGNCYAVEDASLKLLGVLYSERAVSSMHGCMDEKSIADLLQSVQGYSDLASWEIVSMSEKDEGLLKDMAKLADSDSFSPETLGTAGRSDHTFVSPDVPDATTTPWTIPLESYTEVSKDGPWRNLRPRTKPTVFSPNTRKLRGMKNLSTNCVTLERFVQHAWAESTRKNTTLIIFYSGNFERIGIRHRDSQTLYLSDLIHVSTCKDPHYGKLHVGLYITALQDTINRVALASERDRTVKRSSARRKRASTDDGRTNKVKRLKRKRGGAEKDSSQDVLKVAQNRKLAFIYLEFGIYSSPVPATTFRVEPAVPPDKARGFDPRPPPAKRQQRYRSDECISLIVGPMISWGAMGVVHEARLELETWTGEILVHDVVVKLSLSAEHRKKLWYEYSVYCHLSARGVSGILTAVGLFENSDEEVAALVLTRGGPSIHDRGINALVSPPQKTAFLRALKEIHAAGVRHGDLRAENLLAHHDGDIAIIDFDRAKMNTPRDKVARERVMLGRILDGDFDEDVPTP